MRIAIALAALTFAACVPAADAPIPPGYAALVESARSSVLGNYEGLFRPSLAVTQVRCFANGGVIVMFRQIGGANPGEPAFAMGGGPGRAPDAFSWSGGYGDIESIEGEIEFNYGDVAEIACPPRAT